jgi:hypothetical protein
MSHAVEPKITLSIVDCTSALYIIGNAEIKGAVHAIFK